MPFLRRHWPVIVLALLPLAVLWPCVFLGKSIGPWDQVMQMAPWNAPKPTSAWDVLQADGVLQFAPWRELVFEAWGKGQLPLWNPYQLCGTPLLANSQSGGFYPLHILMGVLHVPASLAITLLAWFHLAWAGLGARWLAKLFGANEHGAVFAGAGFGMSAFMVSWTPLASVVTTCSWIPWVLGFGVTLARPPRAEPLRARIQPLLGLSGAVAMMLLGGHLQFAAYGFIGLFTVILVSAFQHRPPFTTYPLLLVSLVLGSCLAAPQVLPVLEFSKQAHRQSKPTPEGAAAYLASAVSLPELSGFVLPAATGLPGEAIAESPAGPLPGYWPAYVRRGAAFAEGALGIGLVAFALVVSHLVGRWAPRMPLLVAAVVGFGLATGPLSAVLYSSFPGWSSTGSPGRAIVLVVLALTVLAGSLWPTADGLDPKVKTRLFIGAVLGVALTAALLVVAGSATSTVVPGLKIGELNLDFSQTHLQMAALSSLAAFVGLGCLAVRKDATGLVLTVASLLVGGSAFCLPSGHRQSAAPGPGPRARVAFVNQDWELLAAAPAVMPGNTASLARIHDVGGYDSLLDRDTLEMLRAVNSGQDPAPPANGNMMFVKPGFDPQKLAGAGVTEVWTRKPLPQLTTQPEVRGAYAVYPLPGPGRANVFIPRSDTLAGEVRFLEDGTDRQVIQATGPGRLIVRDRLMKGWTATIDGRPVEMGDSLWRELELPAGQHTVEFRYDPPGLRLGTALFAVSALICAGLAVWSRPKRPENEPKTPKME